VTQLTTMLFFKIFGTDLQKYYKLILVLFFTHTHTVLFYIFGWICFFVCDRSVAAGQVISRLQFTWFGSPSHSPAVSARAFQIVFIITVLHFIVMTSLWCALFILDDNDYSLPTEEWKDPTDTQIYISICIDITKYMYLMVTVFLLYNVRRSVRSKYAIPGDDTNDCCLSIWCPCLVAGQLLRHTTDYDVYTSQLCTHTGLPDSAPRFV
jgi:hypothetical protein